MHSVCRTGINELGAAASGTFAARCPAIARPPHRARKHSRQGSNLQHAVLETAALPLELQEYKTPPLESNQPCLHTRTALQTALRRQMARYCGIEPHPISRFGGVSICTYRIDAQSAKREERKMPAKPKGGKLSWRFVSETACIGLPFRHCRWYYSITFARFLYIPRTYRVHTRSCTKNHAFFMHFRQNRKKVLLPRSLQGLQTLL